MILNRLLVLIFAPLALGSMRYVVDRRSCNTDELHDKVKYYMDTAKSRADLVANLLRPFIGDPDNNQLGDRINNKATLLFGASDYNIYFKLYSTYDQMSKYVWVDTDVWSDDWKKDRDNQDLQIHCNADHVVDDSGNPEPNINWKDTVQDLPLPDGASILVLKDPKSSTVAVASPAEPWQDGQTWPVGSPEVISLHPEYLKSVLRDNVLFNSDRIEKAIINSLVDRIKSKFKRVTRDLTNIDILDTPEATMMHELTHLMITGNADDSNYPNSYGWVNCIKLKEIKNAESLMFFAMTVDLIQNHSIDVDEKGKLKRFT